MKKNGEYVGVDEKFIPENEKYVNDSILGNKEESTKKIKKVAKGFGIGYLIIFSIILIAVLFLFVTAFKFINNSFKSMKNDNNDFNSQYAYAQSQFQEIKSESDKKSFNDQFEMYSGTVSKLYVSSILDNVAKNNKTNSSKIITVIYNKTNTTDANKIIELKQSFKQNKEYEVILDYNADGFVEKVTIKDLK